MDDIRLRVRDAMRSKAKALTQSSLARLAGMTPDAFSRALNGQRHFSASELAKIAKTLEVSLEWLVTGKLALESVSTKDQRLGDLGMDPVAQIVAFPAGAYREVGMCTKSMAPMRPDVSPKNAALAVAAHLQGTSKKRFIDDLPFAIEQAYDVSVFVASHGPDFDARAMRQPEVTYVVVRGTRAWYKANWALARELGELFGGNCADSARRAIGATAWAGEFADELLLPEDSIAAINWDKVSPAGLAEFLWQTGVSGKVLAARLTKLGIVSAPALVHADEGTLQLLLWHNPNYLTHRRVMTYQGSRIPFDLYSAHLKGLREGRVDGISLARMLDTPVVDL